MRVVFDTQVWLRGLLATDPNLIGSALLQAVRDRLCFCVGSGALISEVDETLSAPHIARNLTQQQAQDARALVLAFLEPLVEICGEKIGCRRGRRPYPRTRN